jgi:DNA-binding transcriptional ArsR family regulator
LGDAQLREVAELFAVLAEPTRLRLLQVLQRGPASVTELIDATGLKQANASKQLGILHAAGLVGRERDGNVVRYSIRMPLVFDLCRLVCDGLRKDAEARAKAWR